MTCFETVFQNNQLQMAAAVHNRYDRQQSRKVLPDLDVVNKLYKIIATLNTMMGMNEISNELLYTKKVI